ncbi:MAG: OmpA family protein [Fibromonadales bacterium]|nr:OmpA family protein [Fibromonadales bacterium]
MNYSSNFLKNKIFALFFVAIAFSVHAGEGNINFNGQLGIHKTQSAQTLGHGRFGIGMFLEGADLSNIIKNNEICDSRDNKCYKIGNYIGGNGYAFLSLGLSDYFDFSIGIPGYGEYLQINEYPDRDNLSAGGWGDLFFSIKWRFPFDDVPVSVALFPGIGISTGRKDTGVQSYGPWIRDPRFLGIDDSPINPTKVNKGPSAYSNTNPFLKLGLAATLDFSKIKKEIPLLFHLNYAYRMPLGKDSIDYPNVQNFSVALEWTPVKYVSFFGEYYMDIPVKWPTNESKTDLSTVSLGTSFHLSQAVDLQLGIQIFTGNKDKYIDGLTVNMNEDRVRGTYSARLIPEYMYFGGFTVKLFSAPEPEKKEEYRNPDTDDDTVCDPWVAEAGKQQEFSRICKGIDLCPYEQGPRENKGCPVQEAKVEAPAPAPVVPAPTIIFTAMPDVVQKGHSVTLAWQVTNATKVSIEGIGDVPATGNRKVKPTENTVYTLTAVGEGGTQIATTDVEVAAGPLPVILFTASSESVQTGNPVTLKWQVTNATEVSIEGIGKVLSKGSKQVKPTENTVYTLTAVGEGGTQTETVAVEVTAPPVIEARVNLQGVTFGSGNATLTANAKKILDGVAEQLLANPKVKIEIQGHTDNVGNPKTNQDLSDRRAKAVVAYLATKGVKMSRMKAVGYGQDVPIADNATADGRELNRRIEMIRVDD